MPTDRAPACSCASPVLRDSTAQGCRGHHMGSSPRLQLLTGTQRLDQGSASRTPRCACCGAIVFLDAGFSSARLADLCLCADGPQSSGLCVLAADGPSLGRHGSRSKSRPSVPAQACHEPCTLCRRPAAHTVQPATRSRAHRAANTQPSAVGRRAAVHAVPLHSTGLL